MKNASLLLAALLQAAGSLQAQEVPVHAQGLTEKLLTVSLGETSRQQGVLSIKTGTEGHAYLAVLLPGSPSVVRPEMSGASMVKSKLTGNFLIRSRRHLANDRLATLIVDCPTDSGDSCSPAYQSSPKRLADVDRLIDEARREIPSIREVWLIGTSLGTVSSAFLAKYGGEKFSGAIHTASITAPYVKGSVRELAEFDYGEVKIAQAFVHHKDDPCRATPYSEAVKISSRFNLPLLTVYGGSDFSGDPCQAATQHGFKGMERAVMLEIAAIVAGGKAVSKDVGTDSQSGR